MKHPQNTVRVGGARVVADRVAGRRRHRVPARAEVEGAADADNRAQTLLVGRGTRRVVAAEADAGGADAIEVDVVASCKMVEHCRHRPLVARLDVAREPRLPLPGTVERERREPPGEEDVLPAEELLLRRVEAR